MKASTLLLSLPAALQLPTTEACSCTPPGDTTGAEIAESVRNSDSFVFVGRVLNETSYASVDGESILPGDDAFPREYQNITFSLDETLVESKGSLPSYVVVGDDGATTVETHTETTCCFCAWALHGDNVGAEYLMSIGPTGKLGSFCSPMNCRTDTEDCAEIVTALRDPESGAGTGESGAGTRNNNWWM